MSDGVVGNIELQIIAFCLDRCVSVKADRLGSIPLNTLTFGEVGVLHFGNSQFLFRT